MPNLFQFEWERFSDGYDWRRNSFPDPEPFMSQTQIAEYEADLQARSDRGERNRIVRVKGTKLDEIPNIQKLWLTPKNPTAGIVRFRPLEKDPDLFAKFVSLRGTPRSFLAFASTHGLLRHRGGEAEVETFHEWSRVHSRFREWFDIWRTAERSGDFREITSCLHSVFDPDPWEKLLEIDLAGDGRDRPTFRLTCGDLERAMILQFAQAVSNHMQLRRCAHCGKWFAFGLGGETKRKSAEYCSYACKQAIYRKRKEKRDGINSKA